MPYRQATTQKNLQDLLIELKKLTPEKTIARGHLYSKPSVSDDFLVTFVEHIN